MLLRRDIFLKSQRTINQKHGISPQNIISIEQQGENGFKTYTNEGNEIQTITSEAKELLHPTGQNMLQS